MNNIWENADIKPNKIMLTGNKRFIIQAYMICFQKFVRIDKTDKWALLCLYDTISLPKLRRNIQTPSSCLKCKPKKQQAGSKQSNTVWIPLLKGEAIPVTGREGP
jgi:hypothetical protein